MRGDENARNRVAMQWETTSRSYGVLPVPGGPWTTIPSAASRRLIHLDPLLIVEGLRRGCRFRPRAPVQPHQPFRRQMAQALPDALRRAQQAHHQHPCRTGKLIPLRNALDRLPEVRDVGK